MSEAYPERAVVAWFPGLPDDFSVLDFSTYDICIVGQCIYPVPGTDLIAQLRNQGCGLPIIDTKTSEIVGVEALTRWRREDGSFLSPSEFIPIVEKSGALIPITEWGIEKVCRQIKTWHDQKIDLSISFNLSMGQLLHPATIDHIRRFINEYDIPECRLKLELTEGSLMEDEQLGLQCLNRLTEIGCPCAIDDFGIGYSSMSRLHKLPVSILMIDKSFVLNALKDQKSSQICQIIILLAHKLGLKVVAEGIETFALVAFSKAIGCDMLQGFYFSEALPADQ